ncbi:MAG: replicative DNA helicase [bacterium]|jgi:replicative DNA helicase
MSQLLERIPPQNLEAEQSVLGAMLIEAEAIPKVMEILRSDDFYREAHSNILQAMARLFERGEAVDLVTVTEELRQQGQLENAGGAVYLASLANAVPTAANVEYYARIVEEKSVLRKLINTATAIVASGFEGKDDVEYLLDLAEQQIFGLAQRRSLKSYASIKTVLMETFERIEHLYNNKGGVTGVPTGFKDLDMLTSGLQPSELIVVAARPSMGKTVLCLNIARNVAVGNKIPVALFSLEMSRDQLAQRLLCADAGVDGQRLRTGYLTEADWPKLSTALGRLSEAPIFIDDTPGATAIEIRAKARRIKAEHGLGLIIIDYLQLMNGNRRSENRQQEISEISRSLKALARELNVPVVALSQLSRAVEQRQDRHPMLSDLRESGAIEQDADVVAFIYRDEYYNAETEKKGIAELIISKQRNGPTGQVELFFRKELSRFDNLERHIQTA